MHIVLAEQDCAALPQGANERSVLGGPEVMQRRGSGGRWKIGRIYAVFDGNGQPVQLAELRPGVPPTIALARRLEHPLRLQGNERVEIRSRGTSSQQRIRIGLGGEVSVRERPHGIHGRERAEIRPGRRGTARSIILRPVDRMLGVNAFRHTRLEWTQTIPARRGPLENLRLDPATRLRHLSGKRQYQIARAPHADLAKFPQGKTAGKSARSPGRAVGAGLVPEKPSRSFDVLTGDAAPSTALTA